jgi:hypothetical protein
MENSNSVRSVFKDETVRDKTHIRTTSTILNAQRIRNRCLTPTVKPFFCSLFRNYLTGCVIYHWISYVFRMYVCLKECGILEVLLDLRPSWLSSMTVVTSTNFLLHPHLRDPRSSSSTASILLHRLSYHWRVTPLQWSLPFTVTHLSVSPGLCPGTRQLTDFCKLSPDNLLAFNSLSVW